jgi:acyl-CoA thioesterase II
MNKGCDSEVPACWKDHSMQTVPFLGVERADDHGKWCIPDISALTTGGGFLFGGAGLGAAVAALERTTGRRLRWATAQYLSFATPPDAVELTVTVAAEGNASTQARVVATVGDREILTVNGALGERDEVLAGEWAQRPDGRSALWARVPELDCSAALLGLLGDHVPFGVSQALGAHAGGRSLDNTIRVARIVSTDWVLLDIRVHAIADGYGHGLVHLWADDGTLLGTASQTCAVRRHRD